VDIAKRSVWRPSMEGPVIVIEHDLHEGNYWGAAASTIARLQAAALPVKQCLAGKLTPGSVR
jgi:hypothetical protein